jgi:hypothetical protein
MKKHFKHFVSAIVLSITILVSLNAQTKGSESLTEEKIDINSKAQELGISSEQLQEILNSSINNGGGNPLPDAMQERFFTGLNADDTFGMSLSSAGDVNGDGYDDIIIGAPNNDAGGGNAGRAYVFFGGNIINSLADIILTGTAANDLFGRGVSTAGDVNGDGYSDVIVGIPGQDAAGSNAGAAYIYFGGESMDNIADVMLTGEAAGDQLGFSVASVGDVNGDGYSDVITGAFFNDAGGTDAGRAYIYFGGQTMNNTADVILTAEATGDQFGYSVSTAGDVNGDGYSDAIVSGSRNDTGGTDRGRAYIYFGGQSMDNIADVILTGDDLGDTFGSSVSTAGDVNGDGYSDVIVGAANEDTGGANSGSAYVFYGGSTMDITADVMFIGDAASDQFGLSVSECGDINGDGYSDVIVGAYFNDVGGSNAGRAYIYFGGISMDNINDGILTGEAASDQFGWSVSDAGDINGDGYSDVIVGAANNDAGGADAGRAYIYFGGNVMDNTADVILTGAAEIDFFGNSVSTAGDVNGDGYSDVIVGAYKNDAGGSNAGRAYIYFGGASMDNLVDVTLTGEATLDNFGYSVSTAGDVNGDGYSDVIVGAPNNDAGGTFAGRAYIYFGGNVMDNTADVILTGAAEMDFFGNSVSTAGDVNGDGYSDVIVGAANNDAGGADAGRAYIYFGGNVMDNTADVILTGAAEIDFFGNSVSTAGDVNGDGYSDVIVGAYGNDAGGYSAGRAYIYFGGNVMDNTADIILTGETAIDLFSNSVSTSGDVNGDGYSDVIVGAYGNNAGGYSAGRAYLYLSTSPIIQSALTSIRDIANDQGGFVRVKWNRSGYDIPGQNRIAEYILQRSDPPGTSGFVWDYVATIPAIRAFEYSYVSPTPSDSFSNSSGTFYFRVIARGIHPDELWYSNIMYGHSVDNLSPSAPRNFYAGILGDDVKLGWKANSESDLLNCVIYRTDVAGANPDTLEIYAGVFDTTFIDTNPLSGTAYYFLKAQDVHNNLSPFTSATMSAQTTFALSVNVTNGWNMVSIPGLHPVDQNVSTWWQYRDPGANVFKYTGGYQLITSATPGVGYWMKHSGARTYNTGDEWPAIQIVTNVPIIASEGWNLIGGYENIVSTSTITTTPPGLITGSIFGYSSGYYSVNELIPGYAYWIKLTSSGQINIPNSLVKTDGERKEWISDSWGRIIFKDAENKSYTLYAVEGNTSLSEFDLPPLPPAGVFDIRFGSHRFAENLNGITQTIEMNGVVYPVSISVEAMTITLQDETGQKLNVILNSGEQVVVNDLNKIYVSGNNLPVQYSLEQNYPNPFNPSTKIRYSIPSVTLSGVEGSLVTLKVYDVLGNEVVTLVNEEKPVGNYEVEFNASGFASGIYFYRIQAGSFVQSKKMILIK